MKKTLIAASVGALMLAAAGTASANSLLFPYFTTSMGAQSVLSLSNTGAATTSGAAGTFTDNIHYVYNYGPTCKHFDAVGAMSANDTLTHSVAAPAAGGFGLAIGNDKSTPVYFPLANQTGFLVVTNQTATDQKALRGSMAIVDPSSGLVVSYAGIDNASATEGDFSGITDLTFPLTALPGAFVSTSWYGVAVGNMNTAISTGADWTGALVLGNGGQVWNNDEVAYSGTQTTPLNCAGSFTAANLVNSAQGAAVGPNGGLIKMTAAIPTGSPATGAVLMKMQAIQPATGGVFVGKQFLHRELAGFVAN